MSAFEGPARQATSGNGYGVRDTGRTIWNCVPVLLRLDVAYAQARAQDVLPSTTNPAERIVYRGDKTVEQQQSQQLACYQWSVEQTGWNPEQAYAQLEQEHGEALAQYQSTRGGAVRGAAAGALTGLAIGAIAGDAGKGGRLGCGWRRRRWDPGQAWPSCSGGSVRGCPDRVPEQLSPLGSPLDGLHGRQRLRR